MKLLDILANLPIIETERLLLRKITLNDASDMFEYASNPEVSEYTMWSTHTSIEDTKYFLKSLTKMYKRKELVDWGIVHKAEKKFIGTCGYVEWSMTHSRAEIGYALSARYWREGYMSEAVNAIIEFGFREMLLNRIVGRCEVNNIASARVMEKVGMQLEGILRQQLFVKGRYWDLKIYSLLREEFFNGIVVESD
ncbi:MULTISPECIES: GNAT family protein [unclassified Microcoleus]|uniref:GNAT family N-acetyltransferase n=1 Tax=unclassified Microcoleus TaxID=2642155 RepID=UPI001E090B40|nr:MULTISPECIES: GNAT family protein [unclassified Microcoleus]TAE44152.1 MAG: N-acetyltransferase [Oscillatoriales cyanobacterium]MCC3411046.1 GNAT family N-acetyltransferase [Microcoleus sp. PH2017_02_FOX_O_A]MCC3447684.1 GNAT family N-acetyltransferase [Microcoleus sp. PH2017_09_SFU_O_A]MCC3473714.1 GNAT family N-acetyltransferase [Microcoleus sp. PH2017_13_LAR_U_A]MCC3486120.1 GNAT family N-acetyltransferase [Microcoleus sp. PH2017_14_LAR_D_A]